MIRDPESGISHRGLEFRRRSDDSGGTVDCMQNIVGNRRSSSLGMTIVVIEGLPTRILLMKHLVTNSTSPAVDYSAIAARYSLAEQDVVQLSLNLKSVEQEIIRSCEKSGRLPSEVKLIAVTKYVRAPVIAALYEMGVRDVGESRPQNLALRRSEVEALFPSASSGSSRGGGTPADLKWHLIGHLQRNKADLAISKADAIHSCDSDRLLARLDQLLMATPRPLPLFLEINISGEASKHGFTPDEARTWWRTQAVERPAGCMAQSHLPVGLMTMAPIDASPEELVQVFSGLKDLKIELDAISPECRLPWLSMGMSGDFPIAIECGATHVRVGSRLYEGLLNGCFLNDTPPA